VLGICPTEPFYLGLDSLVIGSAEAVTADSRALIPGIIFKSKELQKQWFLKEFKQIADWYYITLPNR
jgi:hypothetical protein